MKYEKTKIKNSELYYYKGEDRKLYGEGYVEVGDFGLNGLAKVKKEDGLYYFINEDFEIISEGYREAFDFNFEKAIVEKTDGLMYFINEKCETVSEGFEYISPYVHGDLRRVKKTNGKIYLMNVVLEVVGEFNSQGERMSEEEFKLDLYLDGELKLSDLPKGCFIGEHLEIIKQHEGDKYKIAMENAVTEGQRNEVHSNFVSRADFVKGKAYEATKDQQMKNEHLNEDGMGI